MAFNERHRVCFDECAATVDSYEIKASTVAEIRLLAESIPVQLRTFVEIPINENPAELLEAISSIGRRATVLSEAKNNFDAVVIYSCIPVSAFQKYNLNCKIVELDQFKEKFIIWFFRKAKEVAHLQLYRKNNFGIQDNFNSNKTEVKNPRGYATRFIYKMTALLHSESWILRFNKCQQLSFRNNPIGKLFYQQLKEDKIDLLLFTHQRPPFIAPLIYQAEKLKIKTDTKQIKVTYVPLFATATIRSVIRGSQVRVL